MKKLMYSRPEYEVEYERWLYPEKYEEEQRLKEEADKAKWEEIKVRESRKRVAFVCADSLVSRPAWNGASWRRLSARSSREATTRTASRRLRPECERGTQRKSEKRDCEANVVWNREEERGFAGVFCSPFLARLLSRRSCFNCIQPLRATCDCQVREAAPASAHGSGDGRGRKRQWFQRSHSLFLCPLLAEVERRAR